MKTAPTASTYRRRRLGVFGGLGAFAVVLAYLPLTLFAPLSATSADIAEYAAPLVAETSIAWPSSAATAVGAVGFPGVLASTGTDEPRSIASITKVVTALVVLDAHPLGASDSGPTITFGRADVRHYDYFLSVGGAVKPVRSGMSMTQREVMQVMLITSANNYAESLAQWAFGSADGFRAAARAWLDSHGLSSTQIHEPSGMDPSNVSTVSELLEIGKMALADPTIAEIVATPELVLPHLGAVKNSNKLLGTLGIDGIKTGTLDEAGACLLFSSDVLVGDHSVTVVGVALGGVDHKSQFPQVLDLMQSVAQGFHDVEVIRKGDVLATYSTPWGVRANAVAAEGYSQLVWGSPSVSVEVNPSSLFLADAGSDAGRAVFAVNETVVEIPLLLSDPLTDPGPAWRLAHPFSWGE